MRRAIAAAAMLLTVPAIGRASDIRVAPVAIDPLPGARTTALTLSNAEQRPVRVQVRVMRWTSRNGADVPVKGTAWVIVAPPKFAPVHMNIVTLYEVMGEAAGGTGLCWVKRKMA